MEALIACDICCGRSPEHAACGDGLWLCRAHLPSTAMVARRWQREQCFGLFVRRQTHRRAAMVRLVWLVTFVAFVAFATFVGFVGFGCLLAERRLHACTKRVPCVVGTGRSWRIDRDEQRTIRNRGMHGTRVLPINLQRDRPQPRRKHRIATYRRHGAYIPLDTRSDLPSTPRSHVCQLHTPAESEGPVLPTSKRIARRIARHIARCIARRSNPVRADTPLRRRSPKTATGGLAASTLELAWTASATPAQSPTRNLA